MPDHGDLEAAAAATAALLAALLTVPTVAHFAATTSLFRAHGYGTISGYYEDDDGEATEASTRAYSDLPSRVAAWLSSSLGLAASIAAAVLSRNTGDAATMSRILTRWADVVAWVSLKSVLSCPLPLR